MATRVQRAWDRMRELRGGTTIAGAEAFRAWLTDDLVAVSKKLHPLLEQSQQSAVWKGIWDEPVSRFAIRESVWNRLVTSVDRSPVSFDPVRVFEWGCAALWSLCVFVDPDEACDHDQFALELWWSASDERPALVCGLGEAFEFRRRSEQTGWKALTPWRGDWTTLQPATRETASRLYPGVRLLV